jgi:hypothetical protein
VGRMKLEHIIEEDKTIDEVPLRALGEGLHYTYRYIVITEPDEMSCLSALGS